MTQATRLDSARATRLDTGTADARATRLEQPARAASGLPTALAARVAVEQQFPTAGAEADVYLVRERSSQSLRVLKLYRPGLKPKSEVLDRVARGESRHLIRLHEHGESGGLWYELLEYARYGSLRTLMQTPAQPEAATALALGVVRELSQALEHLHSQKIVHRDIKPENVLVRQLEPLDLVLTDFGISSVIEAAQKFTGVARTIRYSAPEAAAGAIGEAADWWSLGMILVELAAGRHPYEGLSEAVTLRQQMTKDVDVGVVRDARLRRLCAGLLQRDPERRWGAQHVERWLRAEAGSDAAAPAAPFTADTVSEAPLWRKVHSVKALRPYRFGGGDYVALQPLATAMWSDWRAGLAEFVDGRLLAWIRDDLREQSVAGLLIDWKEHDSAAHYKARRNMRGNEGYVDPLLASAEERFFALLSAVGAPLPALADAPDDHLLTCAVHARRARRRDADSAAWLKQHLLAQATIADPAPDPPATLAQYRQAVAARVAQAASAFEGLETGVGFRVEDQPALLALIALAALGHDRRPQVPTDSRAEIEAFNVRLKGRLRTLLLPAVPLWMREELWAQAKPLVLNSMQELRKREAVALDAELLRPLRALETALSPGNLEEAALFQRLDRALPKTSPRPTSLAANQVYAQARSIKRLKAELGRGAGAALSTLAFAASWAIALWGAWQISKFQMSDRIDATPLSAMAFYATLITLLAALAWYGERRARFRRATRRAQLALADALKNWIAELEQEMTT
jgi:tRNA A-37 threonylcarbamoyl transferase component Bud32